MMLKRTQENKKIKIVIKKNENSLEIFADCSAEQGDQERAHPGDAHVPGQLGHVPHPGELPRGVSAAAAEAGLALQRVGVVRLRLMSCVSLPASSSVSPHVHVYNCCAAAVPSMRPVGGGTRQSEYVANRRERSIIFLNAQPPNLRSHT